MNKVSFGAWGATIIWVAVIGWVAFTKRAEFAGMEPNAVGDFLAGTVSPLALIWLVAGYLQQGKELKLNTQALKDQQDELKKQVEATNTLAGHFEVSAVANSTLAELSREKDERERKQVEQSSNPNLMFSLSTDVGTPFCSVHNKGGPAIKIKVLNSKNINIPVTEEILAFAESMTFPLDGINWEDDYFYVACRVMFDAITISYTVTVKDGAITSAVAATQPHLHDLFKPEFS